MLKRFCCLFLTVFSCQACGRMWEVMIKKLCISGNRFLVGFLVLVLFHSLFRWLSLHPCAGDLQHFPLRWQCQHGVQGGLQSFCRPCSAVTSRSCAALCSRSQWWSLGTAELGASPPQVTPVWCVPCARTGALAGDTENVQNVQCPTCGTAQPSSAQRVTQVSPHTGERNRPSRVLGVSCTCSRFLPVRSSWPLVSPIVL